MNEVKFSMTEEKVILIVNGEQVERLFSLSIETIINFDYQNDSIKSRKIKISYTNLDQAGNLEHRSFYVDKFEAV